MTRHIYFVAFVFLFLAVPTSQATDDASGLSTGPHDANLGEVQIHYVVRGHGPILVVTSPGWGIGSDYLQKGLKPLEKRRTVVYVDTRGSGGSTRPVDRRHMAQSDMADDIDKLRSQFGLTKIDLLGHSDGGAIALEYAIRYSGHLGKLILVDPVVLGDRDEQKTADTVSLWASDPHYHLAVQELQRMERAEKDTVQSDEQFQRSLELIGPLYLSDPVRFGSSFTAALKDTHLSAWAELAESDAASKAKRVQTNDLKRVAAVTLVMNGTVDWVCPYTAAQSLAAGLPNGHLSLYANKGHVLWIEDPERFFAEVNQFLAASTLD